MAFINILSFSLIASRVTWLYLMKNKNEVFACFKDFHRAVQTQYGEVVKVLRNTCQINEYNIKLHAHIHQHKME